MKKLFCCLIVLLVYCLIANSVWAAPLVLNDGPHLFLDDYLIESKNVVIRKLNKPFRQNTNPIIPSIEIAGIENPCSNFNYEVDVIYDPVDNNFKMWHTEYDASITPWPGHSAYRISEDGVNWGSCTEVDHSVKLDDTQNKGIGHSERFVSSTTYFHEPTATIRSMNLFFSSDGINWQEHPNNPVLHNDQLLPAQRNDIWDLYYDPIEGRYGVMMKPEKQHIFTDVGGRYMNYVGRTSYHSTSSDLTTWSNGVEIFPPDSQDEGQFQWYGCADAMRRGEHIICMGKVLHDDFKSSDTPYSTYGYIHQKNLEVFGIGYTVLAWSHDGDTWYRDRADPIITGVNPNPVPSNVYPNAATYLVDLNKLDKDENVFLAPDPNANANAWDHAHTWIDAVVPVGDLLYLYYGGYKYGHKIYSDRGIGLAIIKKDRYAGQYVGVDTSSRQGTLTTKLIKVNNNQLKFNIDTAMGRDGAGYIDVEILDQNNNVLDTCDHIGAVDEIEKLVTGCDIPINTPIKLRFKMKNAILYAIYLGGDTPVPTATSSPTPTTNPNAGRALQFDGIDDAVKIGNEGNFDFTAGNSITIETWIKPTGITSGQNEIIVSKGKDDYPKHFRFYIAGASPGRGKLVFFYDDQNNQRHIYQTGDNLIANNQWQHVAFTYTYGQGSSAKLYLNGSQVTGSWESGSGNTAPKLVDNPVMLGAEELAGINERYNGVIDEARIYQRALAANEVSSHYNSGQGQYGRSDEADLLAGWHLDGDLGDYSGNGNNGNLEGNPQWVEGLVAIETKSVILLELIQNYLKDNPIFDLNADGVVSGLDFVAAVLW